MAEHVDGLVVRRTVRASSDGSLSSRLIGPAATPIKLRHFQAAVWRGIEHKSRLHFCRQHYALRALVV